MGTGYHGGFGNTMGAENSASALKDEKKYPVKKKKEPIFSKTGHVTLKSIKARAEFFLGKSVAQLDHELQKHGYKTQRRPSTHSSSKAKIIMTLNSNKERNVSQIQVSPGSKRHGNVPYVKISTTDIGIIKIVGGSRSEYKSDGKEKAKLIFRRDKND